MLGRNPNWLPALRWTILALTALAAVTIGGFTGRDPVPILGQFKADVAAGKVAYYVVQKD